MSHCRIFFYNHLDYCFIVFKHIQQSFFMRRWDVWWNNYFLSLLCSLTSFNKFWVVFPKIKKNRSDKSRAESRPISIEHPKRWFLILLNPVKLTFVSYTSNLSEQWMTSQIPQSATRSRIWISKISRNIGVLKQSQSALCCSVTNITILFVLTCVMNGRYQPIQAFATDFGPFCNRPCKFVQWTWNI